VNNTDVQIANTQPGKLGQDNIGPSSESLTKELEPKVAFFKRKKRINLTYLD
jgi:hypothetical protein